MEPEFEYREVGGKVVAHLTSGNVRDERDATDLVGNASFGGAHYVLVDAERLPPDFFDLSSGFAGKVLQKFSNYRLALVVVGYDQRNASDSLRAMIGESNRGATAWFVDTVEAALAKVAAG